jgi:hypothetical protein
MTKYLWWWLFAAVPVTLLCMGMYAVGQQVYRQLANDPQVQMAEDGAARLDAGGVPAELVTRGAPLIDIAASLDPWVVVYDQNGQGLEASAQLDHAPAMLPAGVFNTHSPAGVDEPVWQSGEYRFTWQPRPGVRQAVVVVRAKNGYFVAAGRSLRLSEERTSLLGEQMLVGWLGVLVIISALQLAYVFSGRFAYNRAWGGR